MKTLKQVMGDLGGYQPKPEGEQNFVKKHVVDKKEDMNGNGDDVFKATKVKTADRPGERHGYTDKDDDKVNEAVEPKEAEWVSILKKYKIIGNTEGSKKTVAEEVEAEEKTQLGENVDARARFEDYHRDAAEMVKKIGEALKAHKGSVSKEGTHWGHVGDVKHFHRQLQDLHDQLTQQGEYQRAINAPMREEVELDEKTLTPAELKKREEIAQAMEREKPGMAMKKKMAIATAVAKRVAEEVVVEAADAKEGKKAAKGKAVMPATGVYDSIPLGISVKEQVEEETDVSLLEMFAALDDEEQKLFVEMLESDGELLGEIAKESK